MEIRLRLTGGETVCVEAEPRALAAAFREAGAGGGMLEVEGAAGHVLAVNPAHVLWWERVPWEGAQPAEVRRLHAAAGVS